MVCLWCTVCSVVCLCQLFCSAWKCCLEEVYNYINVCNCDKFSVVNVYLDHLKFCVVCINGRRYICCSECNVVSDVCIYIIYYRFIVRFPIGLDFLFITFTFLLHLLLSWTSSLSISSSAISASTLSNHVFLGLPTSLLPSTLYSIHFFTQSVYLFHIVTSCILGQY